MIDVEFCEFFNATDEYYGMCNSEYGEMFCHNVESCYYRDKVKLENCIKEIEKRCRKETELDTIDRLMGGEYSGTYVMSKAVLDIIDNFRRNKC